MMFVAKQIVGMHDRNIAALYWKQTFRYSSRQEVLIAKKMTEKKIVFKFNVKSSVV